MTIAVCYLSPEGIVLGADSTSSVACDVGMHYFDFNQKVFEIGENSTLGMLTWGMGGLSVVSYRSLLALLADDLLVKPAKSVTEVMDRWIDRFWMAYSAEQQFQNLTALQAKTKHDPNLAVPDPTQRTKAEEDEYNTLKTALVVGFCIAGYVMPDRVPEALFVVFDPLRGKPAAQSVGPQGSRWWGVPNIIARLIFGCDHNLQHAIVSSGKWNGSPADLQAIISQQALVHPTLPIRDAVDFVHACIHSTIKAMKFSNMSQICGGPIEVAVITTDRKFRWVRHKPWDAAITEGA